MAAARVEGGFREGFVLADFVLRIPPPVSELAVERLVIVGIHHFFSVTPANSATAPAVVWAAFSPRRKSLSLKVVNTSVG